MPSLLFITLLVIACLHAGAFGAPKCKSKHGMHGHSSYIPTPSGYTVQSSSAANEGASTTSSPATQSAPTSTPSAAPSKSAPPSTGNSAGVSSTDIDDYLLQHNNARDKHGASHLTWNDTLSAAAQKWADGCVFKHSGGTLGPYGENLAAGTGVFTIDDAVKAWTNESSSYKPDNPVPSHFTQVVWKGTTQVGCAVQNCSGIFDASFGLAQSYVCEYFPAGNVIGQFPENVQV